MKHVRAFYYAALLVGGLFSLAAMAAPQAPSEIKIGTLHASSGTYAAISTPVYNGLKLWAQQVNEDGGAYVKPYDKKIPVKLVTYDDQSSTATAATLYNRLITSDKVDLLVSDSGSVLTSVAVPIAQEHKMLLFDQTGTGAKFFSPDNPYIVQLDDPVSSLWPKPLADFLKQVAVKHDIHKVAILFSTNDFTGTQAHALKGFLKDNDDIDVVYFHGVPTSTSSYTVLLHRIQAEQPDALLELGYPDNDIAFLRDLQSSGIRFPMVFTPYLGIETELLEKNVGEQAMMHHFTYVTSSSLNYEANFGMPLNEFSKAYHKAYGKNLNLGFNSVAGYNTGLVIQKTLATTQSMDQLDLRKAAFKQSGQLKTLNGEFKLRDDGAQIGELTPIGQIQSGGGDKIKLVPVFPEDVATGKPMWPGAQ